VGSAAGLISLEYLMVRPHYRLISPTQTVFISTTSRPCLLAKNVRL
jgi:hypothetical protein